MSLPPSPLPAARALAAAVWVLGLCGVVLAVHHPLVLLAGALVAAGAAGLTGAGHAIARTMRLAIPFALFMGLVNALVVRDGLTVVLRLGEVPPLGQVDVTLEALAYGLLEAGRIVVSIALLALASAAVDADEVLRALRRVSFRSALTAALAARMVPVLARDARRMALAQRARADGGASRLVIMRALAGGVMDRALDVAATLEVRGYATAAPARAARPPWSRHDTAFTLSGVGVVLLAALAARAGWTAFTTYPEVAVGGGAGAAAAALALVAVALAPFADRKGIER